MRYDKWLVLLTLVGVTALTGRLCFGQIKLAGDRPKPSTSQQSAKLFRLPKGLRIEIVASEPHLADPVAMDFDARGRIFVCEIHGYNLEGYWDIVELNKQGALDTKLRRIDATAEAQQRAAKDQYGTVKLLEDTDGDGRMDKSRVWADRLPPCYGVVAAQDGVIVVCPPDVLFLADRDGDGKAEVRQQLYKTGGGPMWNRPGNPRWSIDNWIYYDGGFRFKPDGTAHEPTTGKGQFGLAMSDWGDRFYIVQVRPVDYAVPLPHRYLARNPYYGVRAGMQKLLPYNDVYPISQPHPWRTKRAEVPAWFQFYAKSYGEAEAIANGYVTSACGNEIYRAAQLPPEYRGNYFFCENAQNFVHRCLLQRDGAGFRVKRAREDKTEFLASTEVWFRPVNLLTGPDGGLYIVDMYREIIEDYSAIPRFLQQQYVESLIAGKGRGRIWRVVAEGAPRPEKFDLTQASTVELVRQLSSNNAWHRQTAQRLLVERDDRSASGPLASLGREGKTPQARLHALCTLDGIGALDPATVAHALDDPHFGVRTHALRLAEPWLNRSSGLFGKVLAVVDDPDAKVRLQLALTLGETKDPRALQALADLATQHGSEPWMADAILSSAAETAGELTRFIVARGEGVGDGRLLLGPLSSIVGARHNDEEIASVLATMVGVQAKDAAALQATCLKGLAEGLQSGKSRTLTVPTGQKALHRLLATAPGEVKPLAVRVAGLLGLEESEQVRMVLAAAGRTALDGTAPLEDRRAALSLLSSTSLSQLAPIVKQLLDPRQPLEVQLAAVTALSSADQPEVGSVLLANWRSYTPKVQAAVLEAIFSRQNRLPKLLDAMAQGTVQPSNLGAARWGQLEQSRDAEIRQRAKSLLVGGDTRKSREAVVNRYMAALRLPRDSGRGKKVFDEQCAKCHKLRDAGYEVGADLSSTRTRADETLIADVMDPSREITVGYRNYTVLTEDGRMFTGVLSGETATSVTLRKEEAAEQLILRKDIDEMEASPISMMPEDLEKLVSPQDLADLIGYLRESLCPAAVSMPVVTLFDEDRSFLQVLSEGEGKITIETDDPHCGDVCLKVTPPQRFSAKIPDWQYRIAENPAPGEFRYLRFAWKSHGSAGVMLELAADGAWPPAKSPARRYYSGRNTTGWAATRISPRVPDNWVLVTCDLWKDFGSFVLTGIAPTTMGGEARFDRIELARSLDDLKD